MTRAQAPTERRWKDPRGTRRGSVEFGGKGPGRKPRGRRAQSSSRYEQTRGQRLGRRLRGVGRFGAKHRGSLLCVVGSLAAAVSLVAFEGTVQLIAGVISVGIAGAGAAVHHHQRTKLLNRNPKVSTPSWRERKEMANAHRRGQFFDGTPHQQGKVSVTSHTNDGHGVKTHTRAAPGQGKGTTPTAARPRPTTPGGKSSWYDDVGGTKCKRCKGSGHNPDWDGKSPDCCSSCRGFGKVG